jgi:DNA-binding MarR family transcriptional regulator
MAKDEKDSKLFEVNLEEIDAKIFILFLQTADVIRKYSDAVLNKAGLSLAKHMVLQVLQAHGGTLTPSSIARMTMREKHTITTLVRHLQQDQLVQVVIDNKDKRYNHVVITDKGKQALISTTQVTINVVKQVMSSIPDSSATILEEPLKTLRQNAYNGLLRMKKL